MKTNEKCTVEVELQLLTNDASRRYKIKRSAWLHKLDDGGVEQVHDRYFSNQIDGTKLELFVQIKKEGRDVKGDFPEPEKRINQLLPEKINEYFFFDGERLDDYFKETSGEKIHEAVFKISQLELIDRMIDRLGVAKSSITKSSKESPPIVKELEERKAAFQQSLEEMRKEKEKLIESRKKARENRNEINKKLRESSVENVGRLAEERDRLSNDLSELEKELVGVNEEKTNYLIKKAPSIFTHGAILQCNEMINKRKEAGEIPPKYRRGFLEKLLKDGKCICGTDISKKGGCRKNVEEYLKSCEDVDEISGELIELCGELRMLREEGLRFKKEVSQYDNKIKTLEEKESRINKRLKEIEDEIRGCDIENIRSLEEKLEEYDGHISKVDGEIGELNAKIGGAEKRIEILENDIKTELRKEEKRSELNKIRTFCEKALEIAETIKEQIMEETRKEIEDRTKNQFLRIIWKKETYTDVKIDDNYNLSVLDQTGREALSTLSAGEREALALSLMSALNEVSGFDVPIVIDTPLGRIAQKQRMNIADSLSKLFEKTQVTLLVTDTEYTPEVREKLIKNVWKEYKIKFYEGKHGSEAEVVPYEN